MKKTIYLNFYYSLCILLGSSLAVPEIFAEPTVPPAQPPAQPPAATPTPKPAPSKKKAEVSAVSSGTTANVVLQLPTAMPQAIEKLQSHLSAMIRLIPTVRSVQKLSRTQKGKTTHDESGTTTQFEQVLQVKFTNSRIFPDSLITVQENHTQCGGASALEDSEECSDSFSMSISGPVHSYDRFNLAELSNRGSKVEATSLADSFSLEISVSALDSGSEVHLNFGILNTAYQNYFTRLKSNRLISEVPMEQDIREAVMLWGVEALRTLRAS